MFFRKKDYHKSLIEKMNVSRYKNVEAGVCYGLAAVGLQAILLRDTATFDARINCLFDIPSLGVPYHIAYAREEWKKIISQKKAALVNCANDKEFKDKLEAELKKSWDALDKRKKILLTAMGFFDSVMINQAPGEYQYLFPKDKRTTFQEVLISSPLVTPDALAEKGGITMVDNFCGAYTVNEIHQLLVSLRTTLNNAKIQFPVGLILCSHNHALTIGFDPSQRKWSLIEANSGPTQFLGDYALAKKINSLFSLNKYTIFNTYVYTAGENQKSALQAFTTWRQTLAFSGSHRITKERAAYVDSDFAGLMFVAAQNGHADTIKQLADVGGDVNYSYYNVPSAIYIAAYTGRTDVVKALLERGASPNQDYYTGFSPLLAAANNRHFEIVKLLIDHGANAFDILRNKEFMKEYREYKDTIKKDETRPMVSLNV